MRIPLSQISKKQDISILKDSLKFTCRDNASIVDTPIKNNHFCEIVACNPTNLSLKAATTSILSTSPTSHARIGKNKTTDSNKFAKRCNGGKRKLKENRSLTDLELNNKKLAKEVCAQKYYKENRTCVITPFYRATKFTKSFLAFEVIIEHTEQFGLNDLFSYDTINEQDEHVCIDQNSLQTTNWGIFKQNQLKLNVKRKKLESENLKQTKIIKISNNENCLEAKEYLLDLYGSTIKNINLADKTNYELYEVNHFNGTDARLGNLKTKLNNSNKLSLSIKTDTEGNLTKSRRATLITGSRKRQLIREHNKTENMSVYDPRLQSEERTLGNGFIARGSHNDDGSTASVNHYYHCSQPTMATLCNIGNTCYLNSVVYTLRFAPLFLHNLHHLVEDSAHIHNKIGKRAKSSSLGRNVSGLHMENARSWSSKDLASLENSSFDVPKSNQEVATEKLHELYQNLHTNEMQDVTDPFHADTFLHAIQEVSTIFEGNQQQDAHEFLMCVLDSIRETCQTLIKSISEYPDLISNGLPEKTEIPPSILGKEPERERERESSIIKTSFFSRRSKRKDDATKSSKGVSINLPHKDRNIVTSLSADQTADGHNSKSSSSLMPDDNIVIKDKEKLNEKIKKLGLDFFTEDFEGVTVSTTKCLSCETITEQKETMIDIAVPISEYENKESNEKSQSFIQNSCITREYFRGENKYRCEQCIGYTEAIRSISYEVLPRLLVIQLSRFSGGMEKINSYLPTPFTLQCFCAKCCEQPENKKLHVYKLYSVITHVGATMSVGHYIAYTCSLDWANDYVNCPKDRKRQAQLNSLNATVGNSNTYGNNSCSNSGGNINSEKNVGLMKKMRFGRSKVSSSGDMSKNVKNMNGISSKTITNGVENLNISTTCQSLNCCGIRIRNYLTSSSNTNYNNGLYSTSGSNNNNGYIELTEDNNQASSMYNTINAYGDTVSYGSGNKTKAINSQPTWYMCDDDKIKAMSQREFEDLLSPNRKIMVTPYLLFYARSDLQ